MTEDWIFLHLESPGLAVMSDPFLPRVPWQSVLCGGFCC